MTNLTHNNKSWSGSFSSRSSQVAVIRREFVDLTGDHFSAVVLNQLLYWTQRVKDFDLLLEEERNFNPECNVLPRHGWIYKTANELSEETMLKATHPTMRKYLKLLIDQGWIDERINSCGRWNKTTQYRVNLRKLQEDLQAIGHTLPEVYREFYSSFPEEGVTSNEGMQSNALPSALALAKENLNVNFLHSNENLSEPSLDCSFFSEETSSVRNLHSNVRNFHGDVRNFEPDVKILHSNVKNLHSYTYTENTPKNTNREHAQRTRAREDFDEFFEIWKKHVCQEAIQLTETRKHQLSALLSLHFQNDVQQWERFCERIKASSFLMGEGGRRWHVTLDWILSEDNALKVLEGNFDNPESLQFKKSEGIKGNRDQERTDILASIQDHTWQDWCTQLSHLDQKKDPLSLLTLKEIAAASFAEFDGKLVWIESGNPKALSRINDLRLKLLTVVQQTFPKARNIRTQLSPLKEREGFVTSDPCPSSEHRLAFPLEAKLEKKQPIGEFYAE
ncbi:MAG: hypothetical protein K2W92_00325 [Alphaproteobacteria bacterium]|nr:hypothetical protein [Alphaproteobacteria bacterium]